MSSMHLIEPEAGFAFLGMATRWYHKPWHPGPDHGPATTPPTIRAFRRKGVRTPERPRAAASAPSSTCRSAADRRRRPQDRPDSGDRPSSNTRDRIQGPTTKRPPGALIKATIGRPTTRGRVTGMVFDGDFNTPAAMPVGAGENPVATRVPVMRPGPEFTANYRATAPHIPYQGPRSGAVSRRLGVPAGRPTCRRPL